MLEIDEKLIEAEEKAIIKEAQALSKLREQGNVLRKITSPKFYLSQMADLFQKDKLVQFSAVVPMVACTAIGVAGAVTGVAGTGTVLASVGMAVSNGVLIGGLAGATIATVKIAGKVGENLEVLKGYNPIKARSQERKLMFSMRDKCLKIKRMEELFSKKSSYQQTSQSSSSVRTVKSASISLPKDISKEKVRE